MYFVDLKGLIVHLQNNKPTSRESFQYVMAYLISSQIENLYSKFSRRTPPLPPGFQDFLLSVAVSSVVLFVSYLVLRSYYRKNGGDDGKYFLDRLIAIVWVVGLRFALALLPFLAVYYAFKEHIPPVFALLLIVAIIGGLIYCFIATRDAFAKIRAGSVVD